MTTTSTAPGYAIGVIGDVEVNDELFAYMAAVETSIQQYDGRWISHGRSSEVLEGELPGDLVIIEFPDLATARAWYDSEDYQSIIPLRTRNTSSVVALTEGVPATYSTQQTVDRMRAAAPAAG